jgi:hypothetical protein
MAEFGSQAIISTLSNYKTPANNEFMPAELMIND